MANLLAHGRRQVVDVVENFPEECRYVLETLGGVYHYDALAREEELSPEERLRFHQEHSGPLMKGLHDWMETQLAEHKTEPNSGAGQSDPYLLNHWTKLTIFLRQAGRPWTTTSSLPLAAVTSYAASRIMPCAPSSDAARMVFDCS